MQSGNRTVRLQTPSPSRAPTQDRTPPTLASSFWYRLQKVELQEAALLVPLPSRQRADSTQVLLVLL